MNMTPPYTKWFNGFSSTPAVASETNPTARVIQPGEVLVSKTGNHGAGLPSYKMDEDYDEDFSIPYNSIDQGEGKEPQEVPITAKLNITYTVEDWGSVTLDGSQVIDLTIAKEGSDEPTYGGHSKWTGSYNTVVSSGDHTMVFHYENIDMKDPYGNMSVCEYSYEAVAYEVGGTKEPCACECGGGSCGSEGGSNGASRSGGSTGATSSSGSSVNYSITEDRMFWSCNTATLRGLGVSLGGKVQLYADSFGVALASPAVLAFSHPMEATMTVPEGGATPGCRLEILKGSRIIALRYYLNGSIAPVGVDTAGHGMATTIMSEDGTLSAIKWQEDSGAAWVFDSATGALISYTSPENVSIDNVDTLLRVKRDADGVLQQIWSYWDGLLNIDNVTETGYRIALYTPNQVTGPNEDGYYTPNADEDPFKTFTFSYSSTGLSVAEATPGLDNYVCIWAQEAGGGWSLVRGTGEEAITTTKVRTEVEPASASNPYEVWQVVTTISKGGTVASRTCEVYQTTPLGNLLLTYVDGYDSEVEQTTTYTYDGSGNVISEVAPNGHRINSEYDSLGRLIRKIEPWGGNEYEQITEYQYDYSDSTRYSNEPSVIKKKLNRGSDQSKSSILLTYYTRTEENGIRRDVRERIAPGFSAGLVEVTETWTGDAPNELDRGRIRMTQAENGVQTWYSYEATSLYGAIYTITKETQVNGEAVRSHSTRSIEYINSAGNTVRAEEWVLLYTNEWVKISGVNHTYDVQNRRVGSVKDNNRSSSRTLTCKNQPLREIDENGIQTDYAYDSARQLIEVTRAAVMDGDTCITPETITEYTRDAAGRVLMTKVHTGAMLTQTSSTYDLVGRVTSETDVLGRVTNRAYSSDGLATTETRPNGATLITTLYTDGQLHCESGTGQPYRFYRYDAASNCLRTRVYLDEGETMMSEQYVNGLEQDIISAHAVLNGFVYTRNIYNDKGQLIQTQQDDGTAENVMAPFIYSYDQFGNVVRETLALADEPDASNSRLTITTRSMVQWEDGIYRMVTITHNNSAGAGYNSSTATLVSELSTTLESKTVVTDPRGKDATNWTELGTGAVRTQKQQIPTSNITATARTVDGFVTSQTDEVGITTSQSRSYATTGMTLAQTDGRGNVTTTVTDLAGRVVSATDATNTTTTTAYELTSDAPSCITNTQGKTSCYRYDLRGRKVAEWGTAVQPARFGYDDFDRLVSLTTFRVDEGDITTDPSERTDGDTTTWNYDPASGLELCKTYADNSSITKTYDSFGRLATETNARGTVKTFSYLSTTGELSGIVFVNDAAPAQAFAYTLTGKLASVTDAAGTRVFTYNEYDELMTDCLTADEIPHLITENRDEFGRSVGFAYDKAGVAASSEQYGYGTDGRLASAAFSHNGESKQFAYSYLTGSNLLQALTMPNGMMLTQQYETQRDLLTGMEYKRGATSVVERYYTYDTLGRPLTRQQNRQGSQRSDSFTHNDRSELTAGILGTKGYYYTYDNIGNRKTAKEDADEATNYDANELNQYTAVGNFVPAFDADGNQTKVQTSTGIWTVSYDAENRPTVFIRTNEDGTATQVSCTYDYMGRRATKKVEAISVPDGETGEISATTILYQRYIYRNYLQVACCDLTRDNHPLLWLITWDPTQPVATRPLAIRKDGTWYCYGWDLTKNVCEVFSNEGYISNTVIYSYTPYGAVSVEGTLQQPIQWSSEFYDNETSLYAFNSRSYNANAGRWIGRDAANEQGGYSLYCYVSNSPLNHNDYLGYADIYAKVTKAVKALGFANEARKGNYTYEWGPSPLVVLPVIVVPATTFRVDYTVAAKIAPCCYKNKERRWMIGADVAVFAYFQIGVKKSKYVLSGSKEERDARRPTQVKINGKYYEPTKGAEQQLAREKIGSPEKENLEPCPEGIAHVYWQVGLEASLSAGVYVGAYGYIGTFLRKGDDFSMQSIVKNLDAGARVAAGIYGMAFQVGIRGTMGFRFSLPF